MEKTELVNTLRALKPELGQHKAITEELPKAKPRLQQLLADVTHDKPKQKGTSWT